MIKRSKFGSEGSHGKVVVIGGSTGDGFTRISQIEAHTHSHSTHLFMRKPKKLFMAYAGITHFSRFSPSMTYSNLRTRKFQLVVTTAVAQTTSQAGSKWIPKQQQAPAHKQ